MAKAYLAVRHNIKAVRITDEWRAASHESKEKQPKGRRHAKSTLLQGRTPRVSGFLSRSTVPHWGITWPIRWGSRDLARQKTPSRPRHGQSQHAAEIAVRQAKHGRKSSGKSTFTKKKIQRTARDGRGCCTNRGRCPRGRRGVGKDPQWRGYGCCIVLYFKLLT